MIPVAVDAMGGDKAPLAPVLGALESAKALGIPVCLVGDETRIAESLRQAGAGGAPGSVTIRHAPEIISPEEQPVMALRRKKSSSMVVALQMVAFGEACAVVSAGSTGALMAGGALILGRMPGVVRPAISTILPTISGRGVLLLDAGANTDVKPDHLAQFAVMGSMYATLVLGRSPVRVGLLNIGTEENKGNDATKQAYQRLKGTAGFAGNIEARDVLNDVADVIVCDGFAGNIFIKTVEGVAELILRRLKAEISRDLPSKAGAALLRPAFHRLKAGLDYSEYGGAPLLGLNKPCIKCHGSSDSRAIYNGIRVAVEFARSGAIEGLTSALTGNAGTGSLQSD